MARNPKWERKGTKRQWFPARPTKAFTRRKKWFWRHPDKWTDYPILALGDEPYQKVPIRKVTYRHQGSDKWIELECQGVVFETKRGYVYGSPRRMK